MYCCRICFEDEPQCNRHLVIAPCQCRGTSKWVHRSCLDQWRSTREDKAFASCTECKFKYSLIPTVDDSYSTRFYNRLKYSFMVFRDLTLALLFVQFIIIITSLLIYYFDSKHIILAKAFHMEDHYKTFYYLSGLFLDLSITGMFSCCAFSQRGEDACNALNCNRCNCTDCIYCCDGPYYGPCNCHAPLHARTCFCLEGAECTSCCHGCGACVDLDAAGCTGSMAGECIPALLIILAVFAIFGLLVTVIAGTAYVQNLTTRHLHILQKRALTSQFIVQDLSNDAFSIEQQVAICINGNKSHQNNNNNNSMSNEDLDNHEDHEDVEMQPITIENRDGSNLNLNLHNFSTRGSNIDNDNNSSRNSSSNSSSSSSSSCHDVGNVDKDMIVMQMDTNVVGDRGHSTSMFSSSNSSTYSVLHDNHNDCNSNSSSSNNNNNNNNDNNNNDIEESLVANAVPIEDTEPTAPLLSERQRAELKFLGLL